MGLQPHFINFIVSAVALKQTVGHVGNTSDQFLSLVVIALNSDFFVSLNL